jgi:hypothetical protein
LAVICGVAAGESHPAAWSLVPPDAKALAGIRWETVRQSVFAEVVAAELGSGGAFRLPALPALLEARSILIASPGPLAVLSGTFDPPKIGLQAARAGLKQSKYRGLDLWLGANGDLGVAVLNELTLLAGEPKILRAAIDRNLAPARTLSPLLAKASYLENTSDLWVLATPFPDPIAAVFVPLEVEATSLAGGVSLTNGIELDCGLEVRSEKAARAVAESVRAMLPDLPALARSMDIRVEGTLVRLSLAVSNQQLAAGLRGARTVAAQQTRVEAPRPPEKQVIRILGLDDGPREIPVKNWR